MKLIQSRNRILGMRMGKQNEEEEGRQEVAGEGEKVVAVSFLDAEYESPRSVRYYVPAEMPVWGEG
jgi:hypothetical protein